MINWPQQKYYTQLNYLQHVVDLLDLLANSALSGDCQVDIDPIEKNAFGSDLGL